MRRAVGQVTALLGAASLLAAFAGGGQAEITLTHVHGLSYSPDGVRLMVPSHHGLAIYEGDKWSKAGGPEHDYMGFAASARHIYSSGHPAPGSGLKNPFGLIRSRDNGKSWDKLGLEGETDFHLLATGWNTNAIYVWNPAPSSRMKAPGLHYTLNDGFTWKAAAAAGLQGEPRALAVHPDQPTIVGIATSKGIYESSDSGEHFTQLGRGEGTAVFFDLDGKHFWYGSFDGTTRLSRVQLPRGPLDQIALPPMKDDAVAYIAQNPSKREEYAIATFARSVYRSRDAGRTWTRIADRGQGNDYPELQ